jgi:uncharacterized membrane protein
MSTLLTGLLVFLLMHSFKLLAPSFRSRLINAMGPLTYKVVFSVVALLSLWLMVRGFRVARQLDAQWWIPPIWTRHLAVVMMWPALVLLVSAFVPGSGIKARLRHPMVLSIKVWALAHLIANGHLAHVILFGAILIWAVFIYRAARTEDRSRMVGLMRSGAHVFNLGTLISLVLGSALWFWLALGGGHLALMGVSPLG